MALPFSIFTLLQISSDIVLYSDDVLSLRTFLALSYSELNALAFNQSFKTTARDCAVVSEYVWTRLLLDEAETFRLVKPFNSTSCHNLNIQNHSIVMPFGGLR
ncbi:hypothetical protein IMCC21906_03238 [Spongiibacter sp. IMCC21906]|nr:hypothetical protein IMCC21906_03238 [Spongiibacter sp. IMCC21906]